MKIKMMCASCRFNGEIDWLVPIELDKWPYIEANCKNGHKQRFILSTELYELLFEQATKCLLDGYYREAVGTYNASLERFFEYAIEMMLMSKSNIDFSQFWKSIDRQSERQLGAYYGLWVSTFNELPATLDEHKVKLRNEVVHKGKLASRREAEEYGKYVFDYIIQNAVRIHSLSPGIAFTKASRILRKCHKDLDQANKSPIYVDHHGEKSILAEHLIKVSCLLSNPNILSFEDCLNVRNISRFLSII